ncbi:putative chromosome segregation protein SudA [Dissoconium aciculare CBS 342.82]|uniref:Chromosome segregation protein SudA n=1 Tax=Dissoconium aciculare CBS 342.82 TaxID=1314786 RepID=A0A6J3M2L0_9PEZI|nr:putative chromosome segregation protein SudA [Dissoconium aciculare CBS 342.82]KAF1822261.1 putative chromosome segregation protein SudA [Dissoconium aciculare CBS 342.82]
MFIKQIIIQGFKSYKDQTHNSNFFAAIRFVLSDKYTQLGREERQGLLHEGAGSAVMSAYVEIIFDNSDDRFPTNTPEVKKDEYSLNRKNTTKNEIMNILESAGFSRRTVAGTEVYETRRAESRRIMEETHHKRSKIDDLLETIGGRLGELEEEKEELRQFQERERERKCLDYTINHREQERLQEQLQRLNNELDGGVEQTDDNREALKQSERQLESLRQQMKLLSEEKAQYKEERIELFRSKAQAESDNAAQQAIVERSEQLRAILPTFNARRENEQATRQRLYAKQGRQAQFRTKRERDEWLQREIADHKEEADELEQNIERLQSDIAEMRDRIENLQQAKEQRDQLWREEAKLGKFDTAEIALGKMMDQNTMRGLKSIRRIVQQHEIEGAYGPIGELFEFNEKYKTAVEVTAGMSLFHYVRLIQLLQQEKGGRLTFTPLNRLNPKQTNLPKASDAFDSAYEKSMQQVFGSTIVCPNLQVASQYARSHGVSAITPGGDRSDRKGALTGGYHDNRNSRLDGIVSERRDEIDQRVTKAMSDLQKVEQKRNQLENGYGPLREELRRREFDLNSRRDELERKQHQREQVEALMMNLSAQLSAYQSELSSDFKKALSAQEEQQLDTVNTQLPDLRKQHAAASSELSSLSEQKTTIELELKENLRPRLDQLQSFDAETGDARSGSSLTAKMKERQADLKRASKSLSNIDVKLKEIEASIEKAQGEFSTVEIERANQRAEVERLDQAIKNYQRSIEKGAQRRAGLTNRINELKTHINSLGALPDAAFTAQYQNMNLNTAQTRLHKAQEALKKYGHVNKKAFEQYVQFEKQREALETRRQELDSSDASIRELIEVLDQRKDEAIERTFRQVSKEFATIFERLVPAGKGRLIIQRRIDRQTNGADEDSDDEAGQRTGVENYIGVGISVSFNSKHDEQQRIQQLSGGQKSLCALALVFAIQASDPAPFYLFDEIDANLDAQYRTAVAQLLQESSQTGQFICTTFRPEMLLVAEKCYGVSYLSKASSIDVVSREQALDFVEGQISGK